MPHNIATLQQKCKHFYIENNPLIKEEDGDQFEPPKDPTIETCSITGEVPWVVWGVHGISAVVGIGWEVVIGWTWSPGGRKCGASANVSDLSLSL